MRTFLATILSVIAAGVMLIAYGLLNPRVANADAYPMARPMLAGERVGMIDDRFAPNYPYSTASPTARAYPVRHARAYRASEVYDVSPRYDRPAPRRVVTSPRDVGTTPYRVERPSGRDWKKTAMVIGGSTAAGAGLGAIFGGKKGALIGAAIGGGAGTLFEVKR